METELATNILGAIIVGIGATAVMDGWAIIQKRLFGAPSLDYRLVGRWIGHFPKGRFRHDGIGKAAPVRGEAVIGWSAHYAVGVAFAALLLIIWPDWLRHPALLPALVIGIGSVVAPFFIMQPGLGAGFAASRTPKPWVSRFRSLVAHLSFAVGLFVAGVVFSLSGA
ncbi:MAG: hypothetical protein CMO30_19720 [Tistrella sp.]|jgi:hypothetical protein|uniref:DUF2938 domain-containing protein n=1 Tax=Tistrella mobilis TaxID=171437 RepID=A0A3B9ILD9_9PROT|nr:DUF2938 domain-containing protein [Tistrella sp.]MAD36013.1 hypothetical protein [Tistrella sp.]MBA77503.1 hypothetical protein [Tistrella sp.]HAE48518.1 DUF2938 domain-containing protein [Tistrella mobilis]|tara:strand:+ start:291 stop:791 length:501 start_codon:yes stop_codon:yes gene_type:complete